MTVRRTPAEAIIDLDRKVSRALEKGRGIGLSAEQLDVLTEIGLVERLAEAKASVLREQARCRQKKVVSTSEAASGSTSLEVPEANLSVPNGISGGTIPPGDGSAGRARARMIFG
jgi:2-polyprenyl-6-methoxyphenol hydroxylase-like FAD-dependent oxidoreductase